ncbi:HEAT repeat domain-containing protein [Nocardia vinacea]|uniref:HEAT repeat domain-containing protein n=1 Tax=Nocardia vinacea TaxID=96468 RepID=A0ABZ1YH88_9NOCA|nr:HEAT repeat domain-containing protein [Nocardia vinacea]
MTPTDDASAEQLLADYHKVGGYAETIPAIAHAVSLTPAEIDLLSRWLVGLEARWPGPETEGRGLARLTLAQSLGRKEARKSAAVAALIAQFDESKQMSSFARWSAGNAIYDIPAGVDYFDQLSAIAANRAFGSDRQMVVAWLGKSRHPQAAAVAVSQLDDPDVQGHALEALAKLRAQGVREYVEPFLTSKNKYHRRSADRILRYDQG